ncbi:MAG: DUF3575 domain-containing protein [Bacteroides sp.]|nr:DUF3575 domain-containing protein [Bacteroides sp.]
MKDLFRYIICKFSCILVLIWTIGGGVFAYGAERMDSIEFLFPQGKSSLIAGFGDNGDNITRLNNILTDSTATTINLRELTIVGAASPEGGVRLNENLSLRRAQEIVNLFPSLSHLQKGKVRITHLGRDWNALRQAVETDSSVPYRQEVLSLLEDIVTNDIKAGGEREDLHNLSHLKELQGGVPYRYLYERIFPSLRRSILYLDYQLIPGVDLTVTGPSLTANGPDMRIPVSDRPFIIPGSQVNSGVPSAGRNFYMGVKSNLLYDVAALPSIGVEFYLGKNISIVGNWTYGWWSNDSRHRYWRAYGGDLALRWWFGRAAHNKPLTGHHIGLFGGVTTYDFELGGRGIMGGIPGGTLWDRCMKLGGVEYGYSLPIARRFNLDMTLGVGYLGGKVVKYVPTRTGYMWESTRNLHWFGPVKAEISLVWLIGAGNENRKEGSR